MISMASATVLEHEEVVNKHGKIFVRDKLQLEDGVQLDWYYMDAPQSSMIIALTPEKELVSVTLYRYTIATTVRELPAGAAEHRKGETTLQAAARELKEETGFSAAKLIDLGRFYSMPSETNRWVHYYLALDAHKTEEPQLDDLVEKYFDMSVECLPFAVVDTVAKAKSHGIQGVESLLGLQLAGEYLATEK